MQIAALTSNDSKQFNFKYQGLVRTNVRPDTLRAVRQGGWDVEHPFGSDRHQLKRFSPASNYPVDSELCWRSTCSGTVKGCTVNQSSHVVRADRISWSWTRTAALHENFVLEARVCRNDAGQGPVFFEKRFSAHRLGQSMSCFNALVAIIR